MDTALVVIALLAIVALIAWLGVRMVRQQRAGALRWQQVLPHAFIGTVLLAAAVMLLVPGAAGGWLMVAGMVALGVAAIALGVLRRLEIQQARRRAAELGHVPEPVHPGGLLTATMRFFVGAFVTELVTLPWLVATSATLQAPFGDTGVSIGVALTLGTMIVGGLIGGLLPWLRFWRDRRSYDALTEGFARRLEAAHEQGQRGAPLDA